MKVHIYTTIVISHGICTPKMVCVCIHTENPLGRFRGKGVESSFLLYTKKCISFAREKRIPYTLKNYFWHINGMRNDIRAIDTNFHARDRVN